ncbi:MAG: dihydroorotate dehydrogenase [Chloroflexi bacterium]|nr:dihydroorotate dehydrogenase [Chloroflexota bacterium]
MNLSVELAPKRRHGLRLKNPVMNASGTFGYGTEYSPFVDVQRLGAVVSKGTTLVARQGNDQPRLKETPSGLLNSIGLQNIGVEALVREKAPLWATWHVPVLVNIAGDRMEDYATLASRLDGVAGVSGLEVNISCPNVGAGGIAFGTDPAAAAEVTKAVVSATALPVVVKLTPNVTDIVAIALAVAEAGADAVCVANTFKGMAIDIENRRPCLGNITGGLSGPAVRPLALYMVYQVAKEVRVPVIGCGGIVSAEDALEFIMAGASAVQVGTAQFVNPEAVLDVLEGIEQFMKREGVGDLSEIIGVARR